MPFGFIRQGAAKTAYPDLTAGFELEGDPTQEMLATIFFEDKLKSNEAVEEFWSGLRAFDQVRPCTMELAAAALRDFVLHRLSAAQQQLYEVATTVALSELAVIRTCQQHASIPAHAVTFLTLVAFASFSRDTGYPTPAPPFDPETTCLSCSVQECRAADWATAPYGRRCY